MDSRSLWNGFALNQLTVPVDLPDKKLGIGDAQLMESVGFAIQYTPKQPAITVPEFQEGRGVAVDPSAFPSDSFYYGNSIMGV